MPTTVMSVRGLRPSDLRPRLRERLVYVGRAAFRTGWRPSVWSPPFRLNRVGRKIECDRSRVNEVWFAKACRDLREGHDLAALGVVLYREWLETQPRLQERLPELRGRVLACRCGDWRPGKSEIPCHAVWLAKLANASVLMESRS